LLAAISETVASNKGPWMQFSSLPINSSLQNNPRYKFSLKLENTELIGNDEICIQGHFYVATNFKMAANKIEKLLMISDFNENWYLGVFWSEELIGNDAICLQAHFYEAIISKMAANKIVKLSMVCVGSHFENGGLVKMTLNENFIITNQFLTTQYS
jgi:hypothetical protein